MSLPSFGRVLPRAVRDSLVDRYREPNRRYHDERHLFDVLRQVDTLAAQLPPTQALTPRELVIVRLAALFHDVIYDPARPDNEEASAALALELLPRLDASEQTASEVARLVLLTKAHVCAPTDVSGAVLCDADLSVLAASTQKYAAYGAGVRAEHQDIDEATFAKARADVLRSFLERKHIYATVYARREWERIARRNLNAEIGFLSASAVRLG